MKPTENTISRTNKINLFSKFCIVLTALILLPLSSCTETPTQEEEVETPTQEIETDTLQSENIIEVESQEEEKTSDTMIEEEEGLEGSQAEINLTLEEKYIKRKAHLASIIEKIKKEYKYDETSLLINLEKSQDLWYQYMHAQVLVKYPEDGELRDKSVFNLCYFSYLTELTDQRIKTLELWLIGERQGEVCGGTVKIQD